MTQSPDDYTIDVMGIYDHFDVGPTGLKNLLELHGLPAPELPAQNMWRIRQSLPGRWLPVLLCLSERLNTDLDLKRYIRRPRSQTPPADMPSIFA